MCKNNLKGAKYISNVALEKQEADDKPRIMSSMCVEQPGSCQPFLYSALPWKASSG